MPLFTGYQVGGFNPSEKYYIVNVSNLDLLDHGANGKRSKKYSPK